MEKSWKKFTPEVKKTLTLRADFATFWTVFFKKNRFFHLSKVASQAQKFWPFFQNRRKWPKSPKVVFLTSSKGTPLLLRKITQKVKNRLLRQKSPLFQKPHIKRCLKKRVFFKIFMKNGSKKGKICPKSQRFLDCHFLKVKKVKKNKNSHSCPFNYFGPCQLFRGFFKNEKTSTSPL